MTSQQNFKQKINIILYTVPAHIRIKENEEVNKAAEGLETLNGKGS